MTSKVTKTIQPVTSSQPTNNRKKILNNQQVLTGSQKNEIKKAFDFFDISGSGTI
jgi:Ca2+-binding EF-hand superfamily protein